MDKEEDFIIKSRVLEDRMKGSTNPEETTKLRKAFADLHGARGCFATSNDWSDRDVRYEKAFLLCRKHDTTTSLEPSELHCW